MIDSLAFHDWSTITALTTYMTPAFREWVERPGDPFGPLPLRARSLYVDWREPHASAADVEALKNRLDAGQWDRVVLGYDDAILATAFPAQYAARNVVRAANDWTIEQWLGRDTRLFGLILESRPHPPD